MMFYITSTFIFYVSGQAVIKDATTGDPKQTTYYELKYILWLNWKDVCT